MMMVTIAASVTAWLLMGVLVTTQLARISEDIRNCKEENEIGIALLVLVWPLTLALCFALGMGPLVKNLANPDLKED